MNPLGKCQDCGYTGCVMHTTPAGGRLWLCGDCVYLREQVARPAGYAIVTASSGPGQDTRQRVPVGG
jgi:hypothetical protein